MSLKTGSHEAAQMIGRLFLGARIGFFELFDDLQHSVASHDRIINKKFELRRVFEDNRATNQSLDSFSIARQQLEATLLLLVGSQDADENNSGMEVAGDVHVIDCDQPSFAHRELAANYLANLPL